MMEMLGLDVLTNGYHILYTKGAFFSEQAILGSKHLYVFNGLR